MSNKQKDISFLLVLLKEYRENLRIHKGQEVKYGEGDKRLNLSKNIIATEKQIRETKAKLRELGNEPDKDSVDPPEEIPLFDQTIIEEYPLPLASPCQDYNRSTEKTQKFIALDNLLVNLTKYLAAIHIGQARRDKPKEYSFMEKLHWMARPTLNDWFNTIVELSKLYQQKSLQKKWLLNNLSHAWTRSLPKRNEFLSAVDYITAQLKEKPIDKPSILDFLKLLVDYRNTEWQDKPAEYSIKDSDSVENFILLIQPAVEALLVDEFNSLKEYPLVYTEGWREQDRQVYTELVKWMGAEQPDVSSEETSFPSNEVEYLKRSRLYIADEEGRPQIDLHPFFIISRWEMFVLDQYQQAEFVQFQSCSRAKLIRPNPERKTIQISFTAAEEEIVDEPIPLKVEIENEGDMIDKPAESPTLPPFTWFNAEGRQVLEFALGESLRLGRFWLGVEFLLMGLSRQENRALFNLLKELNFDPGEFRGIIRGAAELVVNEDWREQNVEDVGKESLRNIQVANPEVLLKDFHLQEEILPVITPRMLKIIESAKQLAGKDQIGHISLLQAVWQHQESFGNIILTNLLINAFIESGHDVKEFDDWLRQHFKKQEENARGESGNSPGNNLPGLPFKPPRKQFDSPEKSPKKLLEKFGRDLTDEAKAGKLHAAIGKQANKKIREMQRVLSQLKVNNPLLIGEAGVGKTALVEGLAYELAKSDSDSKSESNKLSGKRIIELSYNTLVKDTQYRGQLEGNLDQLMAEVKDAPDIIIFIDEMHTILGGGSEIANIANALKPALAKGEFPCIGATTIDEYRKHIEKDPALSRRFERIDVEEPDVEDCITILMGLKEFFQQGHNVRITDDAIEACVRLSAQYLPEEKLPAKAVKLLDNAATYIQFPSINPDDKESEVSKPIFTELNEDLVRYVLTKKTKIPLERLAGDELERLKEIDKFLQANVIGQNEAINVVSRAIKRSRVRRGQLKKQDSNSPIGVFLFVGPTGVGKTELAKSLAKFLFHDRNAMIRLDMSEYMEKHQVSRLIGAPPGYVGHDDEGQLTGKLRHKPYSVVLLDEIEKANDEVYNIFLQLFDDGRLTDAKGRTTSGREAIFIMTSNVGSEIYSQDTAGFMSKEKFSKEWLQEKQQSIDKAIREKFKPEFLNRIDRIIHFNPLTLTDLTRIFDLQFQQLAHQYKESNQIELNITFEAIEHVCHEGYNPLLGARPLSREIERLIEDPLTDLILDGKVQRKDKIKIGYNGLQLTFEKDNE